MKILVLNSGSSSLKYQVIDTETGEMLVKGYYERIGQVGAFLTHKVNGEKHHFEHPAKNHEKAIQFVMKRLTSDHYGVFKSLEHHKKAYSKFDEVLCVSQTVKEGVEKKYNIKNARVLYNPINREKILKLSNEKIEDIEILNKFKLISVGRLSEEKGYDRLLRVFKKLKSDGLDIELILVGNGDKYNELNEYIVENKLEKDVTLLGFKENPYKYVRASDLFVCSSISEGFSLVIGEAMAIGIPVVSVDCPGPNEVLDFGKYGELVNNNEGDLYNGIKEMINNKVLYEKYKNKANERGKMFSINKFINEVENILDFN